MLKNANINFWECFHILQYSSASISYLFQRIPSIMSEDKAESPGEGGMPNLTGGQISATGDKGKLLIHDT